MDNFALVVLGAIAVLIVAALCTVSGRATDYEEGENLNVQGKSPRGHL